MTKIALVTGASGSIGAACVRRLTADGFKVLAQYNTARENARLTGAAEVFQADFLDRTSTAKMCDEILKKYKKIDLLVNAAGVSESGLFSDFSLGHIRDILEVNLVSAMTIAHTFVPSMVSSGGGAIVNISSIWGIIGASCETAYSTAKAGIIGFTRSLAKELGPANIRVNCVAPGVIDTAMNKSLSVETIRELKEKTPLNRLGTAEEVAEAVSFFARATFVTGQVLAVDGGFI